ncbi:MAG: cytochrome c biogenesis protein CcsA, partial [bacterium]
ITREDIGMHTVELIFRWLSPFFLALCSFFYIHRVFNANQQKTYITLFKSLAIICLTLFLTVRSLNEHRCPFGTIPEAVLFFCWMSIIAYFIIEYFGRTRAMGLLVMPASFVICLTGAVFLGKGNPLPENLKGFFFSFHVTLSLIGYCAFFLSFICSVLYLIHLKELTEKRFGFLYTRLPSLDTLDRLILVCLKVGLIFLFSGIVQGEIWARHLNIKIVSLNIKKAAAMSTWCVYVFQYITIKLFGWTGKRSAIISIIGFLMILLSLSLGRHGF